MDEKAIFETVWWWIYNNIFFGVVGCVLTTILLLSSIYVFIRWKAFALSMIMLSAAFIIAYAGGFIMIFRGALS